MFLTERHFVTTAHEQLLVLEAVWAEAINSLNRVSDTMSDQATPAALDQKIAQNVSQQALDTIFEQAMTVDALAIMRACNPCQTALMSIDDCFGNPSVLLRHLSIIKGLVAQYTDGLIEIDPEFATQIMDGGEASNIEAPNIERIATTSTEAAHPDAKQGESNALELICLQGRHRVAANTLRPLLSATETTAQADALRTILSFGDEQAARLEAEKFAQTMSSHVYAEEGQVKTDTVSTPNPIEISDELTNADAVLTLDIIDDELLGTAMATPNTDQAASKAAEPARYQPSADYAVPVPFENMMRPITNLILGEARFLKKRISISYGAEFETLPIAVANRVQKYLEVLCLNIVLYGVGVEGSQIEITGKTDAKNAAFKLSWRGGDLAKISGADLGLLNSCAGMASPSSAAMFEATDNTGVTDMSINALQNFEVQFALAASRTMPSSRRGAAEASESTALSQDGAPNGLAQIKRKTG